MTLQTPSIEALPLYIENCQIHVLRGDSQGISECNGNKLWKLHYNLYQAQQENKSTLVTFGGAYSNHVLATAYAARIFGLHCIGIIRGNELEHKPLNHTLTNAVQLGMSLRFVTRSLYRDKERCLNSLFAKEEIDSFYVLPEGGTNHLAIKGVKEVFSSLKEFKVIACAVGTGGTLAGICDALPYSKIFGFPVLKHSALEMEIKKWTNAKNFALIHSYHFGGYGKVTDELLLFMEDFKKRFHIELDAIYTAKMFYGAIRELKAHRIPAEGKILLVHTGGMQGNRSEKVIKRMVKSENST